MTTVLHISVSPRLTLSRSREAGRRLVERLRQAEPGARILRRDLGADPVPHPDEAFALASVMLPADRGPAEHAALAFSEVLIGELEAADIVAIDTPMNNFTLPSALKAWIDLVVRPRRTFGLTPAGKVPLLPDRPVLVAVACGGRFDGRPGAQADHFTPYLRYVLGVIGLASVDVLLMESVNRGPEELARAFAAADAWIEAAVARTLPAGRRPAGISA